MKARIWPGTGVWEERRQKMDKQKKEKMSPKEWRNRSSIILLVFMLVVVASSFIEKILGKTLTMGFIVIVPICILVADLYYWRCTNCNKYLPQKLFTRVTHCGHCGEKIK